VPKPTQADVLVALAQDSELFHAAGADEATYATVAVGAHRETWAIRARGFERWLRGRYFEATGKAPNTEAIIAARHVLDARAIRGGSRPVFVRVGRGDDGSIYLDLGNADWEAVEIKADGWRVVSDPPVKFRRARGGLALPTPARRGRLDRLRPFVNVADDRAWRLILGWLVMALRPTGPYPVLWFWGEHDSAKSTTAEVLRKLVDPNSAMLRAQPSDVRDLMIAAQNSWAVVFDNLSTLPPWLSDALCRLATGGGFATRELYSDADEVIFESERPIILTGIESVVTRADLLDRTLVVELPPIADRARRAEDEFWAAFETERPALLGALCDTVAMALKRAPAVRLPKLPRMADFAVWLTAAAPALGWTDEPFLATYQAHRDAVHELVLEASTIADAVRQLGPFEGTATELLAQLDGRVPREVTLLRAWPRTPQGLTGMLRRLAPTLRKVGTRVTFTDRPDLGVRRRQVIIRRDEKDASKMGANERSDRSDRSSVPPPADADERSNGPNDQNAENPQSSRCLSPEEEAESFPGWVTGMEPDP
jgi:hypothetical protein